jgi:hypothetical protein
MLPIWFSERMEMEQVCKAARWGEAPWASVNAETRLPALEKRGNCTITFERLPASHFPFDFPVSVKSILKAIKERGDL